MLLNIVQLSARCFKGLNTAKVISTNSYIQVQKYSRYASRRPAAIVNEDELFEVEEAAYPEEKKTHKKWMNNRNFDVEEDAGLEFTQTPPRRGNRKNFRKEKDPYKNTEVKEQSGQKTFKKRRNNNPEPLNNSTKNVITKLYENEKLLSPLMLEMKSKKQRKKQDKIVVEGFRLISDAIQSGQIPEMIIYTNTADLTKLSLSGKDIKAFKVPYRTIQLWSSLTTPPGIMGVFKTPNVENFESTNSLPITIVCDNIRDPGNMGSILRAAAGVGCEKVILSRGCVDIWDMKVLRSAAGAHFRLPIYNSKEWFEIKNMLSPKAQVVVADNKFEKSELVDNEDDHNDSKMLENDINIEEENCEEENREEEKVSDSKPKKEKYERIDLSSKIPVIPYFSMDYTQGETVIIVGGETEGLSEDSYQIVRENEGVRVNIPMNNGVESLNSGMAMGIIAFEIKRQFLIKIKEAE